MSVLLVVEVVGFELTKSREAMKTKEGEMEYAKHHSNWVMQVSYCCLIVGEVWRFWADSSLRG